MSHVHLGEEDGVLTVLGVFLDSSLQLQLEDRETPGAEQGEAAPGVRAPNLATGASNTRERNWLLKSSQSPCHLTALGLPQSPGLAERTHKARTGQTLQVFLLLVSIIVPRN